MLLVLLNVFFQLYLRVTKVSKFTVDVFMLTGVCWITGDSWKKRGAFLGKG